MELQERNGVRVRFLDEDICYNFDYSAVISKSNHAADCNPDTISRNILKEKDIYLKAAMQLLVRYNNTNSNQAIDKRLNDSQEMKFLRKVDENFEVIRLGVLYKASRAVGSKLQWKSKYTEIRHGWFTYYDDNDVDSIPSSDKVVTSQSDMEDCQTGDSNTNDTNTLEDTTSSQSIDVVTAAALRLGSESMTANYFHNHRNAADADSIAENNQSSGWKRRLHDKLKKSTGKTNETFDDPSESLVSSSDISNHAPLRNIFSRHRNDVSNIRRRTIPLIIGITSCRRISIRSSTLEGALQPSNIHSNSSHKNRYKLRTPLKLPPAFYNSRNNLESYGHATDSEMDDSTGKFNLASRAYGNDRDMASYHNEGQQHLFEVSNLDYIATECAFEISVKDGPRRTFLAHSAAECVAWVQAINSAMLEPELKDPHSAAILNDAVFGLKHYLTYNHRGMKRKNLLKTILKGKQLNHTKAVPSPTSTAANNLALIRSDHEYQHGGNETNSGVEATDLSSDIAEEDMSCGELLPPSAARRMRCSMEGSAAPFALDMGCFINVQRRFGAIRFEQDYKSLISQLAEAKASFTVPVSFVKYKYNRGNNAFIADSPIGEETNQNAFVGDSCNIMQSQMWKDLQRDEVIVNGEHVSGVKRSSIPPRSTVGNPGIRNGGPEAIIGLLMRHLDDTAKELYNHNYLNSSAHGQRDISTRVSNVETKNYINCHVPQFSEADLLMFAKEVLSRCNRTQSGGDTYFSVDSLLCCTIGSRQHRLQNNGADVFEGEQLCILSPHSVDSEALEITIDAVQVNISKSNEWSGAPDDLVKPLNGVTKIKVDGENDSKEDDHGADLSPNRFLVPIPASVAASTDVMDDWRDNERNQGNGKYVTSDQLSQRMIVMQDNSEDLSPCGRISAGSGAQIASDCESSNTKTKPERAIPRSLSSKRSGVRLTNSKSLRYSRAVHDTDSDDDCDDEKNSAKLPAVGHRDRIPQLYKRNSTPRRSPSDSPRGSPRTSPRTQRKSPRISPRNSPRFSPLLGNAYSNNTNPTLTSGVVGAPPPKDDVHDSNHHSHRKSSSQNPRHPQLDLTELKELDLNQHSSSVTISENNSNLRTVPPIEPSLSSELCDIMEVRSTAKMGLQSHTKITAAKSGMQPNLTSAKESNTASTPKNEGDTVVESKEPVIRYNKYQGNSQNDDGTVVSDVTFETSGGRSFSTTGSKSSAATTNVTFTSKSSKAALTVNTGMNNATNVDVDEDLPTVVPAVLQQGKYDAKSMRLKSKLMKMIKTKLKTPRKKEETSEHDSSILSATKSNHPFSSIFTPGNKVGRMGFSRSTSKKTKHTQRYASDDLATTPSLRSSKKGPRLGLFTPNNRSEIKPRRATDADASTAYSLFQQNNGAGITDGAYHSDTPGTRPRSSSSDDAIHSKYNQEKGDKQHVTNESKTVSTWCLRLQARSVSKYRCCSSNPQGIEEEDNWATVEGCFQQNFFLLPRLPFNQTEKNSSNDGCRIALSGRIVTIKLGCSNDLGFNV